MNDRTNFLFFFLCYECLAIAFFGLAIGNILSPLICFFIFFSAFRDWRKETNKEYFYIGERFEKKRKKRDRKRDLLI